MADGYLNFDTKINESGFNEGINKLGSLGKSGLSVVSKAMTGAVAAVGAGAAAIVKSCKIAPKEKGTHILEVTYAVADSIRKARIEVEVV